MLKLICLLSCNLLSLGDEDCARELKPSPRQLSYHFFYPFIVFRIVVLPTSLRLIPAGHLVGQNPPLSNVMPPTRHDPSPFHQTISAETRSRPAPESPAAEKGSAGTEPPPPRTALLVSYNGEYDTAVDPACSFRGENVSVSRRCIALFVCVSRER